MSTSTETRFFPGDLVSNIYVYDGTVMVVLRVDPNGTDRWKCVYVFNPVTEKEERYFVPPNSHVKEFGVDHSDGRTRLMNARQVIPGNLFFNERKENILLIIFSKR